MEWEKANSIASVLKWKLSGRCVKIESAGSIRRLKKDVGDIELVAQPRMMSEQIDLFGNKNWQSLLEEYPWKKLGEVIKNGPRYKQIVLKEGITLDLFIVQPPAQWGVIFAIRTGPADFSKWLVTKRENYGALPNDCCVRDGGVYRGGQNKPIPMRREKDFFDFLGMGVNLPSEREARW